MRTAVVGVGAVGGYFGGSLAHGGADVIFVARGDNLHAIQTRGLQIDDVQRHFTVSPAHATGDPASVGPVDIVLLAVKAWQVESAIVSLRPLMGEHSVIIPVMDGVEAPQRLAGVFGRGRAAAGIALMLGSLVAPGYVRNSLPEPWIILGELDGRPSERLNRVQEAFRRGDVNTKIVPDIISARWEKLILVGPWSAVGAVTRLPSSNPRSEPSCASPGAAICPCRTWSFFMPPPAAGTEGPRRDQFPGKECLPSRLRRVRMQQSQMLSHREFPLTGTPRGIPAMGFGTLISDPSETRQAARAAIEAGFRHFDCAERYRNEEEVGVAIREAIRSGSIKREDLFLTTKLWNNNHRPERVRPAFDGSRERLQAGYIDLYLIHTPFAFQPGDDQDPRDASGNVIYDKGVTLKDTWRSMEALVDSGDCRTIGLSDVSLEQLEEVVRGARIKPAIVQVESHPYLPQTELLEFCAGNGIVMLAFAPLGHGIRPGVIDDPVILSVSQRAGQTPAQVLLAWAVQRGTAVLTTPKSPERMTENFNISALPEDAMRDIDGMRTRRRFNLVTTTGIPGFIARGN